ncbi:MAG: hypothetical protein GC179_18485 [Anaerolineaceae bacterium]|nr:hypothetical protein [Anaerolineaceae bacterium]
MLSPFNLTKGVKPRHMALEKNTTHTLYQHILRTFAQTGNPPTPDALINTLQLSGLAEVETYLATLEAKECIYRDRVTGDILAAYPFSARPTPHRVVLEGKHSVYAMCAVDALGIPFMLDTDATVHSQCTHCGDAVSVMMVNGEFISTPDGLVVAYTPVNASCCPATDQCPLINFFCSTAHAQAWQEQNPHLTVEILTLLEAVECGRRLFGILMNPTNVRFFIDGEQGKN